MSTTQDIPNVQKRPKNEIVLDRKTRIERESRRYIKRLGGWKKGILEVADPGGRVLSKAEYFSSMSELNVNIKKAKAKIDQGWDMGIIVPGFENITAQAPKVPEANAQALQIRELQATVETQTALINDLMASKTDK